MSNKPLLSRRHVIARLINGAIYFDDGDYWSILTEDPTLSEYFEEMGVKLVVDHELGMGYLRPLNAAEEEEIIAAGQAPIPKVIPSKTLGYYPSLLCAFLRQELQLHEEHSVDSRFLYLGEKDLNDLLRPYLPESFDEKAQRREIRKIINRVEEIGVLHKMPNRSEALYRVEPIIRARIPIDQIQNLLEQLKSCSESKDGSISEEAI
ncbi:MAG: DUF4194 domain-containing protein [Verrucomicrobia bacterium]|nr:DUF4194 domain-containing protein [Verrucomicrobiota bacterium]